MKTRGEVRGGGKKPWRQKGTGRARQGSIRSPQWVGGGVAHGPVVRDHDLRVNKKMKRGALRSALTDAMRSGKLAVVDELAFEAPKTKDAVGVLDALDLRGPGARGAARADTNPPWSCPSATSRARSVAYAGGLGVYDIAARRPRALHRPPRSTRWTGRRAEGGAAA